jgi:hypothetical protein
LDGEKLNSVATNLAYLPKGKAATCDVAKRFDSVVALKLDETMDFSRSYASPQMDSEAVASVIRTTGGNFSAV